MNSEDIELWKTMRRALLQQVRHIDKMDMTGIPSYMVEVFSILRRSNLQMLSQINTKIGVATIWEWKVRRK